VAIPEAPEPALLRPRRVRARPTPGRIIATVLSTILVLGVGAGGVWALTHQQRVTDMITVWQYEPGTDVAAYAERSMMTDEGRFLFYASRPSIEASETFNEQCASQLEDVGILGCYKPGDRRIYLFDVTDVRLDGIEEVVAAHEMLHAAWHRMGDDERERLGVLLERVAATRADDPEFAETLEYYAQAEPGERLNELHSIIGTEFPDVGEELEQHFATYFTDRAAVVALHEKSDAVFTAQQEAIDTLVAQLDALQASVDADYEAYNTGYDTLNADIAAFNDRAESGQFTSQSQFNAERNSLLARQEELDALYVTIDARAQEYDRLVAELNALNAEVAELNESINIEPRDEGGL
jgi:hypothetical protein